MAELQWDRRGMASFLRSAQCQAGCVRAAGPEAARIYAATPRSGIEDSDHVHTQDTTRVEPADFGDRKGALIIQEGAAVQLNFGNARTRALHHVDRGR